MTAMELINAVESAGGRFMIDGDRLGFVSWEVVVPVVEELRVHKAEIIDLLTRHPTIPAEARLIKLRPARPPVQLSASETVVDVGKFIVTSLRQLDHALHGRSWLAGNWGASGLLDRLEKVGCIVALEDNGRSLQ